MPQMAQVLLDFGPRPIGDLTRYTPSKVYQRIIFVADRYRWDPKMGLRRRGRCVGARERRVRERDRLVTKACVGFAWVLDIFIPAAWACQ